MVISGINLKRSEIQEVDFIFWLTVCLSLQDKSAPLSKNCRKEMLKKCSPNWVVIVVVVVVEVEDDLCFVIPPTLARLKNYGQQEKFWL